MGYYLIVLWRCMPFFTKEKKTILGVSDHILNYTEGVSRILKYTYLRFFHQWYRPNRKQGKKIKKAWLWVLSWRWQQYLLLDLSAKREIKAVHVCSRSNQMNWYSLIIWIINRKHVHEVGHFDPWRPVRLSSYF